jgi:hypothetical protein
MTKIKEIIIAVIIIIAVGAGYSVYQSNTVPQGGDEKEQACVDSGGTVATGWCWRSGENFSNTCLIGGCDCPPGFLNHLLYGRKVKFCYCGEGKCFDGEKCGPFSVNGKEIDHAEVVWKNYINPNMGFSMKIPSEVSGLYKCPAQETILVPVETFEDNENGVVYISQEYYYKAEWDSRLQEFSGSCKKIEYSSALLESEAEENYTHKPLLGWAIVVKNIKDESELDGFIKEIYGSGCSAGQKTPWTQSGVYEIPVLTDGTDLGNTTCPVGWTSAKKVLYSPKENKIMSVILGQECTFWIKYSSKCYDEEMVNSFKFE